MFLVNDSSTSREERIRQILVEDPPLAALLSVIHFEWTIRRAIIALGTSPNVKVREYLQSAHGHNAYKQLWASEVFPRITHKLPVVVKDWAGLVRAFGLRHRLVHGVSSCGHSYAEERVNWAITAAVDVREFCAEHNVDLDSRLPVRKQKKSQKT